jgi:hypothetical protein
MSPEGRVDMFESLASTKSVSSSSGSGMKFRMLCIEDLLLARRGNVCFGLIGHGPTFCIRKNCKTALGSKVLVSKDTL